MHKRERRNHQLLVTKGEILEERQAENEAAQKAYDKLLTSVSTLAVGMGEKGWGWEEGKVRRRDKRAGIGGKG